MHRTGKHDTIYLYDTSDRSKQKLAVGLGDNFLSNVRNDFRLLSAPYVNYNEIMAQKKRRIRTHESDSEVTVRRLG